MRNMHAESGHTLIEVMVASVIMTVGALGALPLFYRSAEGNAVASKVTVATALADSALDRLLLLAYDDPALNPGIVNDGTTNIAADGTPIAGSSFGDGDGNFFRSWEITERDVSLSLAGNDYKEIRVFVRWRDGTAQVQRSVSLVSGKAMMR